MASNNKIDLYFMFAYFLGVFLLSFAGRADMITVLAMAWNHRKVETLHKTLAKRFVKVRSVWVYVVC